MPAARRSAQATSCRSAPGDTTGSIVGDVLNDGSLIFSRKDPYSFAGNISGTGSVTFEGGGFATIAGNNSYTGETRIIGVGGSDLAPPAGNSVIAIANSNLGSPSGLIVLRDRGKLVLANSFEITRSILLDGTVSGTIDTRENTVTASGVLSGTGPLFKDGLGTLILTNVNSQTGDVNIVAGALQLGGGTGTGTLNGNVVIRRAPG